MDKFEEQLKKDAAAIDAEVAVAVRQRIDASIGPVQRRVPRTGRKRGGTWLALSGVAALAVLAFILMPEQRSAIEPETTFATTPAYTPEWPRPLELQVQPVALTAPLEEELASLRTDIERVRSSIERELRSTL